ncbi:MAG: putative signal transducing protein [Candidatus Acetothermia bacterium]
MELVEIHRTWNEQKAELMKSLLEDYEINCYLSSHITHSVYPIPVDGLGEIRVMVPKDMEKKATDLLESYFSPEESEHEDESE